MAFIRATASLFAMPWLIGLGVIVAGFIVAGTVADVRWAVVGLMTFTVVAPMVLSLLYFNYGLKRECAFNVMPHKAVVGEGGITVEIYPTPRMVVEQEEGLNGEEKDMGDETPSAPIGEFAFPPEDILAGRFDAEGVTILLGRSRAVGFLRVPKWACAPDVYDAICSETIKPGKGL